MSDKYYLPEIDFAAVKCRPGELTEWLNHVNAVLKQVSQYGGGSDCCEEMEQAIDLERTERQEEDAYLLDLIHSGIVIEALTVEEVEAMFE